MTPPRGFLIVHIECQHTEAKLDKVAMLQIETEQLTKGPYSLGAYSRGAYSLGAYSLGDCSLATGIHISFARLARLGLV